MEPENNKRIVFGQRLQRGRQENVRALIRRLCDEEPDVREAAHAELEASLLELMYTEQMMVDQGFLDHDPLMKLITLKWYLRSIANTMMDQAIHVENMSREQAMKLMIEDTFQQEREADGKWTRAQLTSVQLSTYFVGYQQHRAMREAVKEAWGERFDLKRYNDAAISFGSPPVRYARALILEQPIPE